jgi:hypothetical protein
VSSVFRRLRKVGVTALVVTSALGAMFLSETPAFAGWVVLPPSPPSCGVC